MKFFTLLCCLFLTTLGLAQNCQYQMSDYDYQTYYGHVSNNTNDHSRMSVGLNVGNLGCVTTQQLYSLALLFDNDMSRLEFCKKMYANVWNKQDFMPVYGAFKDLAVIFQLYDYVKAQNAKNPPVSRRSAVTQPTKPVAKPTTPKAPLAYMNAIYPDHYNYNGQFGCNTCISDADFDVLMKPVLVNFDNRTRRRELNHIASTYCLSMGMLLKMASLIPSEQNRFDFLKAHFSKTYDVGNYAAGQRILKKTIYKDEWMRFCKSHPILQPKSTTPAKPVAKPTTPKAPLAYMNAIYPDHYNYNGQFGCNTCISDADFDMLMKPVLVNFDNITRRRELNHIASTYCLSMGMLLKMSSLIPSEQNRFDFLKAHFSKTYDVGNYAAGKRVLKKTIYKDEWMRFCESHSVLQPEPVAPAPVPAQLTYMNVVYPDYNTYNGKLGCTGCISEADFDRIMQPSLNNFDDNTRYNELNNIASSYCLSMSMLLRMASLIPSEQTRFDFVKNHFARTYDMGNYSAGTLIFNSTAKQNEWIQYSEHHSAVCGESDAAVSQAIKDMKATRNGFAKDGNMMMPADRQLKFAREYVSSHCLNISQIKRMNKAFSFDERRLKFLKAAYKNCNEKANYPTLKSELTFSSNKSELEQWLKNQ